MTKPIIAKPVISQPVTTSDTTSSSKLMVKVKKLGKQFGHFTAVDNISLNVTQGEVLGFLGPHGSGKSTTMKMITGFLQPSTCETIEICGVNVLEDPIAAQHHIGYLPEGASAYTDITVNAYLHFIANARHLSGTTKQYAIDYVVERTHIATVLYQPIGTLSKGYQRRLGIAQALIHNPNVLILDEPTDGLDPNQKHEVRHLIREIAQDKAIIISTHILEEVESICTRALIIANGRIVANGTPQELANQSSGNLETSFRQLTTEQPASDVDDTDEIKESITTFTNTSKKTTSSLIRDTWSICQRELIDYFSTPIAYVFMVIFLATVGAFTFFLGHFFHQRQASLDSFFQFHPWLYLFLVPAMSMRLWSEERKSGSIALLLTLPISTLSTVLGKFIAAWLVIGLSLLLTFSFWITVNYLGTPDNQVILVGYLGSFVMAGAYLAIGTCASAMTNNQVIAFIIAAAVCFIFTASGLAVVLEFFSSWASPLLLETVTNFSFLTNFRDISRGVIDLRDAIFFASTIVFFLFVNVVIVDNRKSL